MEKRLKIDGGTMVKYQGQEEVQINGFYLWEIDVLLKDVKVTGVLEGLRGRDGKIPDITYSSMDGYELILNIE